MFIAALAAAGIGLALPLKDRDIRERWRHLAERLGLTFRPGRLLESDGMDGHVGKYRVQIDNRRRQGTHISVFLGSSTHIRICPRHLWFYECGLRSDDHLNTSDPVLPRLLRHIGLSQLFLLLLDSDRETLLDHWVYSAHLGIDGSEITLVCPERIDNPEVISAVLYGLTRLACGIEDTAQLALHFGENARQISAPIRRRLTCLQLLLEHFPEAPETGRASWSIAKGPSVYTSEGLQLRLLSLRHLNTPEAYTEVVATIDDSLRRSSPPLRETATEAMFALSPEDALPRLMRAIHDPNTQVAMIGLRLLAIVPLATYENVEQTLIDLLYRADAYLRPDVVCVLSKLGTTRAIGPLIDLEKVADPGLRKLCNYALKRLYQRFPERESGALSLVPAPSGEVSLTTKPSS